MPLVQVTEIANFVARSRIRLNLLAHLLKGPRSPSELALAERKHVSHVSRALSELRRMGLVKALPSESRERYYRITNEGYTVYLLITRTIR